MSKKVFILSEETPPKEIEQLADVVEALAQVDWSNRGPHDELLEPVTRPCYVTGYMNGFAEAIEMVREGRIVL